MSTKGQAKTKTYDVSIDGGNSSIKVIFNNKFIRYENYFAKNVDIDYSLMD